MYEVVPAIGFLDPESGIVLSHPHATGRDAGLRARSHNFTIFSVTSCDLRETRPRIHLLYCSRRNVVQHPRSSTNSKQGICSNLEHPPHYQTRASLHPSFVLGTPDCTLRRASRTLQKTNRRHVSPGAPSVAITSTTSCRACSQTSRSGQRHPVHVFERSASHFCSSYTVSLSSTRLSGLCKNHRRTMPHTC